MFLYCPLARLQASICCRAATRMLTGRADRRVRPSRMVELRLFPIACYVDMEEESPTERRLDKIRHFPEPLQSYQSTYVSTMGGTTFFLRQDDDFQREAEKLGETLELGIANAQAQLAAASIPAVPVKDAKDSGGKEKDKDKNAAQKQEVEEKKKPLWPIVEDVDLAKANLSWLQRTSMSCLVAHFPDDTRLHVAMHTSAILHGAELGQLSLSEMQDRLHPVTTLTFFTGT